MCKILQSDQSLDIHLFQLIVPVGVEISLHIQHFLFWGKPVHVCHQRGHLSGPMMPLGCSKDGHSIPLFSNVLPSSCRRIRNQTLIKPYGNVILLLHEVNLFQDFLMPKVLQMDGILHFCNNTRMITMWLPMQPVANHKIQLSNQSTGHFDLSHIVCTKYYN